MVTNHTQGTTPSLAQPTPGIESNMNDSFDLSKLFEEDYALTDQEVLAPRPMASSNDEVTSSQPGCSATSMGNFGLVSNYGQAQTQSNQLVNVLLIVDPTTQQVVFPRQQQQQQTSAPSLSHTTFPGISGPSNSVTPYGLSLGANLKDTRPQVFSLFDNGACNITLNTAPSHQAANALHQALNVQVQHELAVKLAQQAAEGVSTQKLNEPPLRALSAYNFFFRDERDRILNDTDHDWSASKQDRLLHEHWSRDRTKKRRHRKTHGKIDFTSLSKLISSRWKKLPENRKEFYREVAARDWERYQEELSLYKDNANSGLTQNIPNLGFLHSSANEGSLLY